MLDLVGVFVFALSGGLVAVQRRLDLFGVLVLAVVAGLGGGILRDVLIGATPPRGLTDWRLLAAAALGGLVTFRWHPNLGRRRLLVRSVRVLDAAGLGAFCVSGALTALAQGCAADGGDRRHADGDRRRHAARRPGRSGARGAAPRACTPCPPRSAPRRSSSPASLGVLGTGVALAAALGVAALRVLAVLLDLNAPSPLRTSAPSRAESRE
ncbi:hypothetical protein GCM10025868_05540 [Angustibacter aerolatus]|uniref:Glycine transporter domain-containing protein n=1 Tax=Angustibacter aerolatus TaxID=1162965 RepID=A0ABQ6JBY0_9ACTN|nr:TRIC cation channel family protein [Angustibacter aerolatus]GMA85304.1 hypothetical protein GCM10025868_05540 [Angustibacter aerolatus]